MFKRRYIIILFITILKVNLSFSQDEALLLTIHELPDSILTNSKFSFESVLINKSNKSIKYIPYFNACDESNKIWNILITKNDTLLRTESITSVPHGLEYNNLLSEDSYTFKVCLDITKICPVNINRRFEIIGKYTIWLEYGGKIKSNKMNFYYY